MAAIVPPTLMFRFSSDVRRCDRLPLKVRRPLRLSKDCGIEPFGRLDGARPFADVKAAWNLGGIGFSIQVLGKKMPVVCDVDSEEDSDCIQIWIDTRNTQTVHRASRFCHRFLLLPNGGAESKQAVAIQKPIPQAREDAPLVGDARLRVAAEILKKGYWLEFWLPGDALYGYDPESQPYLGFFYHVHDTELGDQFATVGNDLPFSQDPSLWTTLHLAS